MDAEAVAWTWSRMGLVGIDDEPLGIDFHGEVRLQLGLAMTRHS